MSERTLDRLDDALARVSALESMLREVEWRGYIGLDEDPGCPVCECEEGHAPGCRLAALLNSTSAASVPDLPERIAAIAQDAKTPCTHEGPWHPSDLLASTGVAEANDPPTPAPHVKTTECDGYAEADCGVLAVLDAHSERMGLGRLLPREPERGYSRRGRWRIVCEFWPAPPERKP
jgi:hypothetical protein